MITFLDFLCLFVYFASSKFGVIIMSSMPSLIESELITGEELLEMPGLGPCELVEGRIVPMSPTGGEHGFIEGTVTFELKTFVNQKKLGWVLTGEAGIFTKYNPDTVRGADILFISKDRHPERPKRGFLKIAPELVVEIISPSNPRKEIEEKIEEYLNIGVNWVWLIDPKNRSCTVYRSDTAAQKLTENGFLFGEEILAGFEIKIEKFFEE